MATLPDKRKQTGPGENARCCSYAPRHRVRDVRRREMPSLISPKAHRTEATAGGPARAAARPRASRTACADAAEAARNAGALPAGAGASVQVFDEDRSVLAHGPQLRGVAPQGVQGLGGAAELGLPGGAVVVQQR